MLTIYQPYVYNKVTNEIVLYLKPQITSIVAERIMRDVSMNLDPAYYGVSLAKTFNGVSKISKKEEGK